MSLELPGTDDVCAADFPGSLCGQGGNPSNCTGPADSTKPRVAAGAGLIWDSPFGQLRVDYAVPLVKQSQDVIQRFRFSAGPGFCAPAFFSGRGRWSANEILGFRASVPRAARASERKNSTE